MALVLIPAAALTLATLLIALTVRGVRAWIFGRAAAPGWLVRLLVWHAGLFVLHALLTVPTVLPVIAVVTLGTRGDESGYAGPRLDRDGRWIIQTRESLAAEDGTAERAAAELGTTPVDVGTTVDPEIAAAAASRAVALHTSDGVTLRAFHVLPAGGPSISTSQRFSAVLVHGLFRGALELEPVGSMLRDLGGELLLLEMRCHGGSSRARFTFGRDEARDVLAAIDWLRAQPGGRERPLLLFAVSLGTAAAALAAPQIDHLDGLILDAPLDDLAATAERMLSGGTQRVANVPQPFRSVLLWSARVLAGVPFDDVRPRDALAKLAPTLPVLVIGAGRDTRIPPEVVQSLFDALPTLRDRKELWIDRDADHGHVWHHDPGGYRARLTQFIARIAP